MQQVTVLVPQQELDDFRNDVKSTWSQACAYVHPSAEQLAERARRASRGSFSGFETAREIEAMNDLLARTYDLLGVLWLTAAGPSAVGDIIVTEDVDGWPFHRTSWLPRLSRLYDYKHERQ